MDKKWYVVHTYSGFEKFLALVAIAVEGFGITIDPTIIVGLQTLMNLVLRKYFTREPIA